MRIRVIRESGVRFELDVEHTEGPGDSVPENLTRRLRCIIAALPRDGDEKAEPVPAWAINSSNSS